MRTIAMSSCTGRSSRDWERGSDEGLMVEVRASFLNLSWFGWILTVDVFHTAPNWTRLAGCSIASESVEDERSMVLLWSVLRSTSEERSGVTEEPLVALVLSSDEDVIP